MSALLSGFLLALSLPPCNQSWLAWIALTPLVSAVWFSESWTKRDALRIFLLGYVMGFAFFMTTFFWITTVSYEGWMALPFYIALYPAAWALFIKYCGMPREKSGADKSIWLSSINNLRLALLCAAAWTGLEWARGVLFTGFGWNGIGVALHDNIVMIQITKVTGVGGLTFMIVLVNVTLVATIKRLRMEMGKAFLRSHYDFTLPMAIVVLVLLHGVYAIKQKEELMPLRIAAVEGNIPKNFHWDDAFEKYIIDTYTRLTETAVLMKPELLIWPEAALPRAIFSDDKTREVVETLARKFDGDFLLGTIYFDNAGDYNSAALLTNHGQEAQLYHKMHLVPFGEFLPLRHSISIFGPIAGALIPSDFTAGIEPVVFEMAAKRARVAPLICFEDTLGDLAREFILRGAQLFVTVTNDGWFMESAEPRQHLANAVFTCAENGIPMVRAANTGITCIIDRFGHVQQRLENEKGGTALEGILLGTVDLPTHPVLTFYARHGELFSITCLVITLIAVLFFLLCSKPPMQAKAKTE